MSAGFVLGLSPSYFLDFQLRFFTSFLVSIIAHLVLPLDLAPLVPFKCRSTQENRLNYLFSSEVIDVSFPVPHSSSKVWWPLSSSQVPPLKSEIEVCTLSVAYHGYRVFIGCDIWTSLTACVDWQLTTAYMNTLSFFVDVRCCAFVNNRKLFPSSSIRVNS